MKYGVLTLIVLSLLGACSNEKEATESNFKKAAQANFDVEGPPCYFITRMPAPMDQSDKASNDKLLALKEAGLLEAKKAAKITVYGIFDKPREEYAPGFELTEEGKKYFKEGVDEALIGPPLGGFCFGKREVVEITNFTEPKDLNGRHFAEVHYKYKITDLPDWAKKPEIYNAFEKDNHGQESLKKALDSERAPIKKSDMFILTNKGWMHNKQFRD